jgi:hypothetical protein
LIQLAAGLRSEFSQCSCTFGGVWRQMGQRGQQFVTARPQHIECNFGRWIMQGPGRTQQRPQDIAQYDKGQKEQQGE